MALTDVELATLKRLRNRLDRDVKGGLVDGERRMGFRKLRSYYEGCQRLEQLGIAVPDDLREFVTIADWPGTFVDTIVGRLRPQGFLLDGVTDDTLWGYWQANTLDTEIRMGLTDMLAYGRGYLCAGTNEDDAANPLLTVESPFQMIHEWSNRERRITAAARFYVDEIAGKRVQFATLYLPDQTIWVRRGGRTGWVEDEGVDGGPRDSHQLGRVPVEVLVNRQTSDDRYGKSEMLRIISLTDACARALTNAQIATEVVALPQKWAAGMAAADFKDPKTGEAVTAWETYIGSVWATVSPKAKFGQFSAADLNNFKTIVGLYSQLVSGITGLPMRYLGQMSDNPPSADGIRADESRIVSTAEEKQSLADGPIEWIMRTGDRIITGNDNRDLIRLEVWWRDPATPTQSQTTDAAVKAFQAKLTSRKQALRDMGKTPQQIKQIEEEIAEELSDSFTELLDPITRAALKGAGADAAAGAGA